MPSGNQDVYDLAPGSGALRLFEAEPLTHKHIPNVIQSIHDALDPDPLQRYLLDTPDKDKARFPRKREDAWNTLFCSQYIRKHRAYTVNGGDAIVVYDPAPNDEGSADGPLQRFLDKITGYLIGALDLWKSPQQKEREQEFYVKQRAVAEKVIGDQIKEMVVLRALATAPEKQGRGYGSMLVRVVTAFADDRGRSTWVTSSNVDNTGFYESFGFKVVGEVRMGEENPTWNKAPVIVRIMVRPPTQFTFKPYYEKLQEKGQLV
ncbi:hypothetical protein CERSUDRAFT_80554 [Gelatoporia subvermispora B]|uniref:N-acetyltransferase domain-containing protein n=1 Tax=Ceriporiopsis subvermispora (strain B) TaxID=914234 RepID=M2QUZ9_CERS8|nr:hypothetical protein CERSUDRAFT_80554 [Gelatoporia subvermispora B]